MSGRICGHCTNWRCDNPLNMMGHCTINRLECGYGRMCDTCTKYQCKWEYTRPEMARHIAENERGEEE